MNFLTMRHSRRFLSRTLCNWDFGLSRAAAVLTAPKSGQSGRTESWIPSDNLIH